MYSRAGAFDSLEEFGEDILMHNRELEIRVLIAECCSRVKNSLDDVKHKQKTC
jgi:hypothetical protein